MRKMFIGLTAALLLAGCGAPGALSTGIDPVAASARVRVVEDRYLAVKTLVQPVLPFLPLGVSTKVRAAGEVIERALIAARVATTIAAQTAALSQAQEQIDMLSRVTPPT